MIRKVGVLVMAVCIAAVFAMPTSAGAFWKHHKQQILQNVTLGFTGQARVQSASGGVECQITSRVKFLQGQTTAEAETFVADPTSATANCDAFGGLALCEVHNLVPLGLNWLIHTRTEPDRGEITTGGVTGQLTGRFCTVKHILITAGNVTATPNQPETVSWVALSGTLQSDLQTVNGVVHKEAATITGILDIEAPNAKTYSI
jgi:hypothetical protein